MYVAKQQSTVGSQQATSASGDRQATPLVDFLISQTITKTITLPKICQQQMVRRQVAAAGIAFR